MAPKLQILYDKRTLKKKASKLPPAFLYLKHITTDRFQATDAALRSKHT